MNQEDLQAEKRLARVIEWSGMNTNHFAKHLGFSRSERLYQIIRGNNGISRKTAELIVEKFPQISLPWLYRGEGEIFVTHPQECSTIDLYDIDVERFDPTTIGEMTPMMRLTLPDAIKADFALKYFSPAMANTIPAGSVVTIERIDREAIIPGSEYVVICEKFTTLRIVRRGEGGEWRLVATQNDLYDDIFVATEAIREVYRVTAKIIINR